MSEVRFGLCCFGVGKLMAGKLNGLEKESGLEYNGSR
jgi:hypothetical protein